MRIYFIIILIFLQASQLFAQSTNWNMEDHDLKKYYFGVNFGYNQSTFNIHHTEKFVPTDSFRNIQSKYASGFHVGIIGSLKLTNFVDLRLLPTILFVNKPLELTTLNTYEKRNLESIYMHVPLQFKFKSDRIGNFRFYGLAGGKIDYDMASNSKSKRTDELIKVRALDYGYELGFGFDFFFSNFILTPEIKLSQGIRNSHFKDTDIPLSNMVDQLRTRMFIFSIMLQS